VERTTKNRRNESASAEKRSLWFEPIEGKFHKVGDTEKPSPFFNGCFLKLRKMSFASKHYTAQC
jgi:hypothetical protein